MRTASRRRRRPAPVLVAGVAVVRGVVTVVRVYVARGNRIECFVLFFASGFRWPSVCSSSLVDATRWHAAKTLLGNPMQPDAMNVKPNPGNGFESVRSAFSVLKHRIETEANTRAVAEPVLPWAVNKRRPEPSCGRFPNSGSANGFSNSKQKSNFMCRVPSVQKRRAK